MIAPPRLRDVLHWLWLELVERALRLVGRRA